MACVLGNIKFAPDVALDNSVLVTIHYAIDFDEREVASPRVAIKEVLCGEG